ncbi:MAG: class I SAM-dependent methyltransferase [Syntrophales bacterium]
MNQNAQIRFQDFFTEDRYVLMKNDLYNYRLRRRAVDKVMRGENREWVLETGSGISPMVTGSKRILYSDLSFTAMQILRKNTPAGHFVVADTMNLPFKQGVFSHVVCSEVLEHLPEDRRALLEIHSVLKKAGLLVLTFPHRNFYFAMDDLYVGHYRRYELRRMLDLLAESGYSAKVVRKVLGPLEKITMLAVVYVISKLRGGHSGVSSGKRGWIRRHCLRVFRWVNSLYACLAWLDARMTPLALSTVLLIGAVKRADE